MMTQKEIDAAYDKGKNDFRKDYGSHGPTLREKFIFKTMCEYPQQSKEAEAWRRGYEQDVRRLRA